MAVDPMLAALYQGTYTGDNSLDNALSPTVTINTGGNTEYNPGGGTNNTTYTAPAPVGDPSLVAYWNNQQNLLNQQLGQLDPTQAVGLGNIGNSYNNSLNRLQDQFGVAQRDYGIGKARTEAGYGQARNAVATKARNQLGALQRLLGIAGAGNSSASTDAVPLAVAQGATQDFAPLQTTYGQNRQDQDTALEDTTRSFDYGKTDLANQKYGQEQGLRQSIAQTRANLLSQIQNAGVQAGIAGGQNYQQAQAAQAQYDPQIQSLLQSITQLGNQYQNPVMNTGAVNYKAPNLMQYLLGQQAQVNQTNPGGDSVNPLFVPLLGKQEDENQLASY